MQSSQLVQDSKPVPLSAKSVWPGIYLAYAARMRFQAVVEPKQMSMQGVLELIVEFSLFQSIRVSVNCQ